MAEMVVQIGSPSEMTVAIEGGIAPGDITGVTATGTALMTAANAAAARTAIGATTVGSAVITAANAAAAQTAIGLVNTQLMTGGVGEVPDSEATDVAGIVADFNELLGELRARNVIT